MIQHKAPKWDGITPAGVDAQDDRMAIYLRDRGICQGCGEPVPFDRMQLAHRIANTKANRKRWGDKVIDSRANRCVVGSARCNDRMNCGGRPDECARIAEAAKGEK